ncbi:sugar kinase [Galbibacter sp. PAP.153]|uniref:sugar kinase n=1 Tax=Galbibacter sp. PAP.153 TaxID=3104623 RepID=UPI00300BC36E
MQKVITFGEILMRLSPIGNKRIQQVEQLDFYIGGTEFNVAVSLANYGIDVRHISNISDDFLGKAILNRIKAFGVDTSFINRVKEPLGLYFLETGSSIRPSRIIYNRLSGAFSVIKPEMVNWENSLRGIGYFYWTGITPGISKGALETLKQGLKLASKKNMQIITDPTYRKNLWNYGLRGEEVLRKLITYTQVFIGGVNEINKLLNTNYDNQKNGFIEACLQLTKEYPNIEKIFDKVRVDGNASQQIMYARYFKESFYYETSLIEINTVVDRIGTGDAFSAGIIYGLMQYDDDIQTLHFAHAACALKHTIPGDLNLASINEVLEIKKGNYSGKIKR